MKRYIFFALTLLLAICATAQRNRRVQTPTYTVTPQEAMNAYNFSLAEEILESQIAALTKKKQPTQQEENLLETARRLQIRLRATEQVTIIDSIVLPKNRVLEQIKLSEENGKLLRYDDFFKTSTHTDGTLFLNELGDHVVYAEADNSGHMRLKEKSLIEGEWTLEHQLDGLMAEPEDNFNYPFLLSDGITLYYAAECAESLGGYDIFMTRYDTDSQQFLTPENIGMPFNSPANDYLLAIDEYEQLGWFVTDRYQPADSVCLYTFIPTETRHIYNVDELGQEKLASLARIASIRDTWIDMASVNNAQQRLAAARTDKQKENKLHDFTFVVNDQKTYHSLTQFINKNAGQKAKIWAETQKELEAKHRQLTDLRTKYVADNDAQRTQTAAQILALEELTERLAFDKLALEKEIRQLEIGN